MNRHISNRFVVNVITLSLGLWMSALHAAEIPADHEPVVVVMFGDSITAGYGLPEADALPSQLAEWFDEKGRNIEIRNAGLSGDTTSGGKDRVDWSMSEDVDVAVVALGGNDMLRAIPPEVTQNNLESIIQQIEERNIRVILAGMLARPNYGPEYAETFNTIYPQLAEQYDLALYPFLLEGVAAEPELNQPDGLHPNAAGVQKIVEKFAPFLDSVLFPLKDGMVPETE